MQETRILDEVLESVGGIEAFQERMDRFERVMRYFFDHKAEWTAQFPRRWVVVTADGVTADADSLEDALELANKANLASSDFTVQFLDPDPPMLFL